jgi:3-methylcrotonyl-CoA carboxylase beta subunit
LKAAGKTLLTDEELVKFKQPILDKYEKEGSPYYSSARLWDDGVVDPAQTRDVLGLCLSVTHNEEFPDPHWGVFRM